jgi:hypothetical protein
MNEHGIGNLAPLVIMAIFAVTALWKRIARAGQPAPEAPRPVYPRLPMEPDPPAQAQSPQVPLRRRLAVPAVPRPLLPPVLPPAVRAAIVPSMADTLPAEAAAAFPTLDLSLPDTPGVPSRTARRRVRTLGGGPAIGSPGWAANAVLAAEIIGSPVSLRSGATLGVPHAF